jgi:ribosome modulation factor
MLYDWKMGDRESRAPRTDRAPIAVRIATWVGRTVGRWQRHRVAKKDDAYVMRWKAAWSTGRDARLAGVPRDAVPHRRRAQREAWLAGWLWADTHADHQSPNQSHTSNRSKL